MKTYTYPAKILRTVDGDTVVLDIDAGFDWSHREHVRLEGVNAPEIFGAKASAEGRVVAEKVRQWCAANPDVTYVSLRYNRREKYGRSLGTIINAHGESLNDYVARLVAAL